MPKRTKRSSHKKRTSFFTKLFYFLGFTVIVFLALNSSGVINTKSVLGEQDQLTEQQKQAQEQANHQAEQQQQSSQSRETETKTADGTVVKTKVEDNGAVKIEGAKPGFQFKLETQNGQSEIQVEDTKGNTLRESDQDKLEQDLEDEGVHVSTEDGHFALTKNNIKAVSDMPISVDTTRREIMITTPNGKTVPVILPDAALQNLSQFGILSAGTASGALALSSVNNIPTYTVPGYKEERLLGVFPVRVPVQAVVSAETGSVMEQNQDFFAKLLDTISF